MTTQVTWIPAHPIYGAVSMRRYWQELHEATRPDDPFKILSVITPVDVDTPPGIAGKALRYWHRHFQYPRTVSRNFEGRIAHVLDHSWAGMIDYVPVAAMKVVTVHDLIPLRFPGDLSTAQQNRFRSWVTNLASADAIVADSEYTKKEVVELLGISGDRVKVVPCGVKMTEIETDAAPLERLLAGKPAMLIGSIGSTLERKNLGILPEALGRLKALIDRPVTLVRVGAALPTDLAAKALSALGDGGLIELGFLRDAEVSRFYRSIDCLVVPSLYEGFGLPVLEGMAARVPVISSDATSLPEVGGEHVLYFDPNSAEDLANRLADVALNPPSEQFLDAAYARASHFSWRSSLEGIFSVYQELLKKHERAGRV